MLFSQYLIISHSVCKSSLYSNGSSSINSFDLIHAPSLYNTLRTHFFIKPQYVVILHKDMFCSYALLVLPFWHECLLNAICLRQISSESDEQSIKLFLEKFFFVNITRQVTLIILSPMFYASQFYHPMPNCMLLRYLEILVQIVVSCGRHTTTPILGPGTTNFILLCLSRRDFG